MHRTLTDIDEELVAQMREHATAYAASTPIRRVTVVANAPLEPSEERRDLIDTSDLVIRCNSLALDRMDDPPCVGTRTNVVVTARTTRPTRGFLGRGLTGGFLAGRLRDVAFFTRPLSDAEVAERYKSTGG